MQLPVNEGLIIIQLPKVKQSRIGGKFDAKKDINFMKRIGL